MSDFDDYKANKSDFEKFQHTESERERERQVKYQESLGPVKSWREFGDERLDRLEAIWARTTKGC